MHAAELVSPKRQQEQQAGRGRRVWSLLTLGPLALTPYTGTTLQ